MNLESLTSEAITLLKSLIKTKSFSSEEDQTALLLELWFQKFNITYQRTQNNIWAVNQLFNGLVA